VSSVCRCDTGGCPQLFGCNQALLQGPTLAKSFCTSGCMQSPTKPCMQRLQGAVLACYLFGYTAGFDCLVQMYCIQVSPLYITVGQARPLPAGPFTECGSQRLKFGRGWPPRWQMHPTVCHLGGFL